MKKTLLTVALLLTAANIHSFDPNTRDATTLPRTLKPASTMKPMYYPQQDGQPLVKLSGDASMDPEKVKMSQERAPVGGSARLEAGSATP